MYTIYERTKTTIFKYATAAEAVAAISSTHLLNDHRIFDEEGNEFAVYKGRLCPKSYVDFRKGQELK